MKRIHQSLIIKKVETIITNLIVYWFKIGLERIKFLKEEMSIYFYYKVAAQ